MTSSTPLGRRIACRFFTADEFRNLLESLYGVPVYIDLDYEGICIAVGEDECCPADLHEKLANTLGVNEVTSIHIDDYIPPGVWIAVKEA